MNSHSLYTAIRVLGGVAAAADLIGVRSYQVIQSWLKTRVPADHCPLIERLTRERGQAVLCEELRPDIPWGVLRHPVSATERAGAPAVAEKGEVGHE
jgi:DNA-binding transcriptional regulator YdaS (Cro superfamily)